MDLSQVATGDYWFGEEAKLLGLVDELKTSDDYLLSFEKDTPIFELSYEMKKTLSDKISGMVGQMSSQILNRLWSRLENQKFL